MMARPRLPVWLMAVLLVLVTIALYWPATRRDFVNYDDDMYVTDNSHVTSGLTWATPGGHFGAGYAANWHPVTWLSHMLDCQMFGLKPWGHHLTSVLLHALNAGLVFALLRQMTGATWRSLLVAALFAVHPLRVESVAWVSERKDVLSGFFGLLALMAYARYAQGQKSKVRSPKSKVQSPKSVVALPSSIFHLLSSFPVLLRPGLDEQADAGDVAVRDVPPGLLAAGENAECRSQPETSTLRSATEDGHTQHATRTRHVSRFALSLLVEKLPFFALAAVWRAL